MPQAAQKQTPIKPNKQQRELLARRKRANVAITEILKREGIALSVNRIQIFERQAGRLVPAGELSPSMLARMIGLPEGSMLMPLVELAAAKSQNGQNAG